MADKNTDIPSTDEEARSRFRASAELQQEFKWAGEGAWVAYCRAARAGGAKRIGAPSSNVGVPMTDEVAAERYRASVSLQKEFRSETAYIVYTKAVREGRTNVR